VSAAFCRLASQRLQDEFFNERCVSGVPLNIQPIWSDSATGWGERRSRCKHTWKPGQTGTYKSGWQKLFTA